MSHRSGLGRGRPEHRRKVGDGAHPVRQPRTVGGEIAKPSLSRHLDGDGKDQVRHKLLAVGIEPTISKSPEEFGAFIKSQAETREKVIKAVGMKLD